MEEQDYTRRSQRPKKRRLRKGRAFFTLLLLCIIVIVGYSVMQYRSGLELANDTKVAQEEFTGDSIKGDIENYLIFGNAHNLVAPVHLNGEHLALILPQYFQTCPFQHPFPHHLGLKYPLRIQSF